MISDTLSASLRINTGNPQIQTAMRILQDELNFVNAQIQRQDSCSLTPPDNPWKHMDSSPFLRAIAAIADEESRESRMGTPSVGPVAGIPSPENFSAFEMIRALSDHHINQLTSPDRLQSKEEFYETFIIIKEKLSREGMLSHYTHNPNINVLYSTDHLKANRIPEREKLSKSDTVSEGEIVSKSQNVDTNMFRNTGFVFFFLERAGSTHRPKTDFGKYRYTVRLADNSGILNDARAIFHDMAGLSSSDRPIRKESPVCRIIESPFNPDDAINWFEHFNSHPSPFLTSDTALFSTLTLLLPSANQRFALRTSDNRTYYTGIEEHLSGNFLQGKNIIDGVALRIAHELMTLKNCSETEYNVLMNDDNILWEYVSGMVHDLQVMIPMMFCRHNSILKKTAGYQRNPLQRKKPNCGTFPDRMQLAVESCEPAQTISTLYLSMETLQITIISDIFLRNCRMGSAIIPISDLSLSSPETACKKRRTHIPYIIGWDFPQISQEQRNLISFLTGIVPYSRPSAFARIA